MVLQKLLLKGVIVMNDNVCEIFIDGNGYLIPCDRVGSLAYRDGYLVNVSSSNITMRSDFSESTSYPYITCSSMGVCNLRSSYNSSTAVTSDFEYNGDLFKVANFDFLIFFILFICLGVRLVWKS